MACLCGSGYAVEGKPRYRVVSVRKLVVGDLVNRDPVRHALAYRADLVRVTKLLYTPDAVVIIGTGVGTGLFYKLHRSFSEVIAVAVR